MEKNFRIKKFFLMFMLIIWGGFMFFSNAVYAAEKTVKLKELAMS